MVNVCKTIDYSKGVIAYYGYGKSPFPALDYGGLVKEYGANGADMILEYIEDINNFIDTLCFDWYKSPAIAKEYICKMISASRPELSEQALRAILWHVAYNFR